MRITVIGMIKNSADIIETFIRANGLFADKFVLIDNESTDNTRKILLQLIDEAQTRKPAFLRDLRFG